MFEPTFQRLATLLGLRPGEGVRTALASLFHLGFVAAVVLVKSASNALVVSRFQADALPPLYIATAIATGVAAWIAAQAEKGRARRLPRRGLILAAGLLGVLALSVQIGLPLSVMLLYLFGETSATLLSIRFWGATSELFDARQSRRIFGILAAAGMSGAILAGLFAQLLGTQVGALGLLPPAFVLLLGCAALAAVVRRSGALPPPSPAVVQKLHLDARAYFAGNRYPRALAALMFLLAALTAVADYLFRMRAGAELNEAEMASLFGALNLWMGIIAVVFQLGAAGRVLERFGIFRYLMVTPGLSAVAAVGCLFVPGIAPAFGLRLVESAGSLSLNPAAFQLLYGPVPDAIRPRIRSAIDGLTKKLGFAAGGALLLLLGNHAGIEVVVGAVVGVVILVIVGLGQTRRLYVGAIESRLTRADARQGHQRNSAESRQVLRNALKDPDPLRVLTAVSLLKDDPRFDPIPHLSDLLAHPNERVRLAAVQLAGSRRVTPAAPHLEGLIEEGEPEVRYEAVLALAKLSAPRALSTLTPLLESDDVTLASAALAGLLPLSSEMEGRLEARLRLPNASEETRLETARLLGRLGPSGWAHRLEAFLRDESLAVRKAACVAAGQTGEPALVELLIECLAERELRPVARRALANYGDEVVPALSTLLDDRERPLRLRLEVPRTLRAIGSAAAARALLFSNIQEHAYLRYRIAVNLSRLHEEQPDVEIDVKRAREATVRRLDAYRYYLPLYRDLEVGLPPGAPLVRAIGDRLQQNLEVIFRLLQLIFPDRAIVSAWRRFSGGDARERAYAIELLEHLLDDDLRARVLPVLECYHRLPEPWGGVFGAASRAPARVLEIAVAKDEVLKTIAIHTALRLWPENPPLPPGLDKEIDVDARLIERVFFLEGVDIFARCDVDDLMALASVAKEREYRAGEVIFAEGEPGDALYVLLEGSVNFQKGGRHVLGIKVRESFGESSLLDGSPRPVAAIAIKPVRALAIDRHDFLELISDRPELLRGIFEAVTRHVRALINVAATAEPPATGEEDAPTMRAS